MRDELLDETMFRSMAHARDVIASCAADYNIERPRGLGISDPCALRTDPDNRDRPPRGTR